MADLDGQVFAAADADMDTVGETMLRSVVGDAGWEGLPEAVREVFAANGPAIVAEVRGGYPDLTAGRLATIDQPTLLVAAKESLQPGFEEVTSAMAAAMPSARVEWVEGGHLVDPAHPVVLAFVDEVLAGADCGP